MILVDRELAAELEAEPRYVVKPSRRCPSAVTAGFVHSPYAVLRKSAERGIAQIPYFPGIRQGIG